MEYLLIECAQAPWEYLLVAFTLVPFWPNLQKWNVGKMGAGSPKRQPAALWGQGVQGAGCRKPHATTCTSNPNGDKRLKHLDPRLADVRAWPGGQGIIILIIITVSYTHLTLPTIYSV